MKFLWWGLGILLGGILLFGLSYFLIMDNLIVDEKPEKADVIVVPEGMITEERARKASLLDQAGYNRSHQFIVSPLDHINATYYEKNGIQREQIINEAYATSTYENARNSLALMKAKGFKSALVVSSDYHMRRTRLVFERVNQKYHFTLHYVAAYHKRNGRLVTWQEAGLPVKKFGQQEFLKYWLYVLGGYHLYANEQPEKQTKS